MHVATVAGTYGVAMTSLSNSIQLVYNARIWQSAEEDMTWMTFSADSGRIAAVGRHDPPLDDFPPNRRRDVSGRRIIPGLHESHIHVTGVGRRLRSVDVCGCRSVEDLQRRVRGFVGERPTARCVVGYGWDQHLLGRFPTSHDLDAACRDRPVYLSRVCYHASVGNSLALQLAGPRFILLNVCAFDILTFDTVIYLYFTKNMVETRRLLCVE